MKKLIAIIVFIALVSSAIYFYKHPPHAKETASNNHFSTPYVSDVAVLRSESEGHLIIDADLKHFFDYLLTSTDGFDVIQVRAESVFGQNLQSEIAKQEAKQLWKGYLEYLRTFTKLEIQIKAADLQDNTQLLRERLVGKKETPAFFADEIALEQKWLNPQTKTEALFSVIPGMGSSVYYFVQNDEIKARLSADKEKLDAYRTELMKQQNYDRYKIDPIAQMNQRYYDYISARDKIMNWDMPEQQKEALIQNYLNSHFSQHELIKVRELDKAHGGMEQ